MDKKHALMHGDDDDDVHHTESTHNNELNDNSDDEDDQDFKNSQAQRTNDGNDPVATTAHNNNNTRNSNHKNDVTAEIRQHVRKRHNNVRRNADDQKETATIRRLMKRIRREQNRYQLNNELWRSIQAHLLQFHKTFLEYVILSNGVHGGHTVPSGNELSTLASGYVHALHQYWNRRLAFELNQVSQIINWLNLTIENQSRSSLTNRLDLLEKIWLYQKTEYRSMRPVYLATLSKLKRKEQEQLKQLQEFI